MGHSLTYSELISKNEELGESLFSNAGYLPALSHQSNYVKSTVRWINEAWQAATQEMAQDEDIQNAHRYVDFLRGRQWNRKRASYKPSPVLNFESKWWWDTLAELTDLNINYTVKSADPKFHQTARNLETLAQHNYRAQRGIISTSFALMHALVSIGYVKTGYSQEYDDVVYEACGPDRVRVLMGNPSDIQMSGCVCYADLKPVSWFYEKYSIPPNQLVTASSGGKGLDNAYVKTSYDFGASSDLPTGINGASSPFPLVLYREFWFKDPSRNTGSAPVKMGRGNYSYWVKPGHPYFPFGRLVCAAGEGGSATILYDNTNPHWLGQIPITDLRLSPTPFTFSGISAFRDFTSLQKAINAVMGDALYVMRQIANPTIIARSKAWSALDEQNYFPGKPLQKLRLDDTSAPIDQQIKFIAPDGAVLAAVPAIYEILKRALSEVSGAVDVNQMMRKKQVPGEGTIDIARDNLQRRYRFMSLMLEDFLQRQGRLVLSDIIQWYPRERWVSELGTDALVDAFFDKDSLSIVPAEYPVSPDVLLGPTDKPLDEPFRRGHKFVRGVKWEVSTGASIPSHQRMLAQLAEAMRGARDLDLHNFILMMRKAGFDLPDAEGIMRNLKQEAEQMPPPPPRRGRPKRVA